MERVPTPPVRSKTGSPTPTRPWWTRRLLAPRVLLPWILLGVAWLLELLEQLIGAGRWTLAMGPGTPWWTLFTAPFSHGGLGHLLTNSLVFVPLSYLVLIRGFKAYLAVWIGVIQLEIPIWLLWPVGSHGLSGGDLRTPGLPAADRLAGATPSGPGPQPDGTAALRQRFAGAASLADASGSELDRPRQRLCTGRGCRPGGVTPTASILRQALNDQASSLDGGCSPWAGAPRKRPDQRTASTTQAAP